MRNWKLCLALFFGLFLLPMVYAQRVAPQQAGAPGPDGDWPMYNRDLKATRYSPLKQINTTNVQRLTKAWSYGNLGRKPPGITGGWEFTPVVVNGVIYVATLDSVAALDGVTGQEIWKHTLTEGTPSRRGIGYWAGGGGIPPRVFFTSGRKLIGLNAATGEVAEGFGPPGGVDMGVPYEGSPTVYKNLLLVGTNGNPGGTRAFDAHTGAKLWEFKSIPQGTEKGTETWEGESWRNRPGGTQWGFSMSVDPDRGIVYAAYDQAGPVDYYGGDRPGDNLFGSSVVALDASTGKMKWYYQLTHHDLFDYDLPAPATLLDVTVNGRRIPALAATTKASYMFILNRETGEPLFGVEERPVPPSDVPGEKASPTQPFPLKPPPLSRVSYKPEDIVTAEDTNAEHAAFCKDLAERSGGLYNAGPYTPYLYRAPGAPPRSTVLFPGSIGGVNWGGMASDTSLGYVVVNTSDEASIGWIEPVEGGSYRRNSIVGPTSRFQWSAGNPKVGNVEGAGARAWPCQKPPWGHLVAVNANTGEIAWDVVLGVTDDLPEGKRNTGRMNIGGPMTTAGGLVFIAATNDKRFRAFETRTGKQLWETRLPMSARAIPVTYLGRDGRQYVAIVAGSNSALDDPEPPGTEALMVYALP